MVEDEDGNQTASKNGKPTDGGGLTSTPDTGEVLSEGGSVPWCDELSFSSIEAFGDDPYTPLFSDWAETSQRDPYPREGKFE